MNWNELLQTLLYTVITTILPIITAYIISFLKAKRDEKLQDINNEYIRNTLKDAMDIILDTVDTISQTFVDDLKKDGKFDKDKQKEALEKAINQAKKLMSEEVISLIIEKYNDLDEWIRTQIEAYIKKTKKNN
jgi:hypothetical protein